MIRAILTACFMLSASLATGEPTAAPAFPELVRRNAPVFVGRRDQLGRPETDRLLALGYSTSELASGERRIRYTAFFSDEDSIRTARRTDRQMARYGRRLDVEWAYEVTVDPRTGRGRRRRIHCDIALGAGHRTCPFVGRFAEGAERPILYVNARHNVFGSVPNLPWGSTRGRRVALDPAFEIPFPRSRDMIPVENPELLRLSDEELAREGKLSLPSTEYAYLRLRGKIAGKLHLSIEAPGGETYWNGTRPEESLREMGLDLWGRESVVAIALPEQVRFALKNGLGSFRLGTSRNAISSLARLTLEEVGLYLVDRVDDRYVTTDLTPRIRCDSTDDLRTCRVN